MSAENNKGGHPENLNQERYDALIKLLDLKEPKLAKGLRKYIRELKKDKSELEHIFQLRERQFGQKLRRSIRAQAIRELDEVVLGIVEAKDPLTEASNQVKAIWIMDSLNLLENPEERTENLKEVLAKQEPKVAEELGKRMAELRDSVSHLLTS